MSPSSSPSQRGLGHGRRRLPGKGARAALALVACLACADERPRVIEDRERGCRYQVPSGWQAFDGELRSSSASLFSIRVHSLEGGDPTFVAALPDSIIPQLESWARTYYIVEGPPARSETLVGGQPALELSYGIRVRATDPSSKLTYWVVRHGSRLFVLRAAYAPRARDADERAVDEILASWSFVEENPQTRSPGGSGSAQPLRSGQSPIRADNPLRSGHAG